jgi:hypothetical protein
VNEEQTKRVQLAATTVANVIAELEAGMGEIAGADIRNLEQGHYQLCSALKQQKKPSPPTL